MASKKKSTAAAPLITDKAKRVSTKEVQEVQKFLEIKQEIDTLKADYPDIFMRLDDLVDQYNTALEDAEKAVRSKDITCGPFENYAIRETINAEQMIEELGENLFLEVGGAKATMSVLSVNTERVRAAIASGKIPSECLPHFISTSRSYHKPDKLKI